MYSSTEVLELKNSFKVELHMVFSGEGDFTARVYFVMRYNSLFSAYFLRFCSLNLAS